jgi:hypothetical protein
MRKVVINHKHMKKLFLYSMAIAFYCLLSACKPAKLLNATFEADAINSPPAKSLPGDPAGDEIKYLDAITPLLKVQNSVISGSKALHYTGLPVNNPPPLSKRYVSFSGIGTDLKKTVWFYYTGQNMGSTMLVDISDGGANLMARMRISDNGEVGLAKNLFDDYTDIIGNIGHETHTIVFTASPATLKYNVTILKETPPAITAEDRPMITQDANSFKSPNNPTMHFLLTNEGGAWYAIGSVAISRKKP